MRIGIYGGTFGPVHNGHLRAAMTFLQVCKPDRLYILPTAIPPHKAASALDTPSHRLEMLRLAFSEPEYADDRITVSDYEQTRGGKSYTVLTLEHFRTESDDVTLLCGTDMFLTLADWYRGGDILRMASVCCLCREGNAEERTRAVQKAEEYRARYNTRIHLPSFEPLPVSSTEIRRRIAAGEDTSGLMPACVRAYIDANGLYRIS
ncbi:MAG: nicotinate (nicotinamide) nucleotide adenylyltransferase [Clostridia bacterium]|nr:nicotinate (nicotinamide) nucleotide adenylyltransferase [Clostridia bacterium]